MTKDELAFRIFRATYPHFDEPRCREIWAGYVKDATSYKEPFLRYVDAVMVGLREDIEAHGEDSRWWKWITGEWLTEVAARQLEMSQ